MIGLASLLAACAASTPSIEARISLPEVPTDLKTCRKPVRLPLNVDMIERDVEKKWREDRKNLLQCNYRLSTMILFYEDLKQRLSQPES